MRTEGLFGCGGRRQPPRPKCLRAVERTMPHAKASGPRTQLEPSRARTGDLTHVLEALGLNTHPAVSAMCARPQVSRRVHPRIPPHTLHVVGLALVDHGGSPEGFQNSPSQLIEARVHATCV